MFDENADPSSAPNIPKMQEPLSNHEAPSPKYYALSKVGHNMTRKDGKLILFNQGVCKATIEEDQKYLDKEIRNGHPNLSYATKEQIELYDMRTDPFGTIETKVRSQVENEVKHKLELDLVSELRKKASVLGLTDDQVKILLGEDKLEILTAPEISKPKLGGIVGTNKLMGAAQSGK